MASLTNERRHDLERFYSLIRELKTVVGGYRYLRDCTGQMGWPHRGVYFFFENGEFREDGVTPRVVRVGTHALKYGSHSTLWGRLSQHKGHSRGTYAGGGNHRGSIFRLHVGSALLNVGVYPEEIRQSWGSGNQAPQQTRVREHQLEVDVSTHIGNMPFLWVEVPDDPGPESDRGLIEAGAIALLSNFGVQPIDPPSLNWLGLAAGSSAVAKSGLWNVSHVQEQYDPAFLDVLERYVGSMMTRAATASATR